MAEIKHIECAIDPHTGDMETHIQGVKGKKCDDIMKLFEEYLGSASSAEKTREYNEAEQPNQLVIGR